jgi:type II secretory pathway pseudopilin PulG
MKTRHFYTSNKHPIVILLPILVSLTIIISSCTFNVPAVDPSKRQTDVARSVESTLNAEKVATYQAQQTLDAGQPIATQPESPNTNATIQAQQATLDAQSTSVSPQVTQPSPADTPQVAPTLVPASSLDPIQILDWSMAFWFYLPNGCHGSSPCWRTNDDYKKHFGGAPLVLTSKQSYLIDQNWPKPYLVFWDKQEIRVPVTVEVVSDGTPVTLIEYPKGKKDWTDEALDLSRFKGKEIIIRFVATGKPYVEVPGTTWYIENIQIIPNYKP